MKTVLPDITKSLYRKITPPEKLYLLGPSSRNKILRAVQLHNSRPPVTSQTREFLPFFEHLAYGIKERWGVQQQYAACRWATEYEDDDLATSMLLHYGWLPQPEVQMAGASMHKLLPTATGIMVDIDYTHTFGERFDAALNAIDLKIEDWLSWKQSSNAPMTGPTIADLISVGMIQFYYFKKRYISIDSEYRMNVTNKMTNYVEARINALKDREPARPTIDEPVTILEPQEFELLYADFLLADGVSELQLTQRVNNNIQAAIESILPKISHLPRDVEISSKDLRDCLHTEVITSAVKNKIIQKPSRGKYIIPSTIDIRYEGE